MKNGYTLAPHSFWRRKCTYRGCPWKGYFSDISCFGSFGLFLKIMDRLGPLGPFWREMLDKTFYHNDPKRSMIFHNSENSPKPKISFFRDTLYLSTRPCKVWRCIGLGTVNSSLWEASVGRDISEGWGSSIVALLWIGQKKMWISIFSPLHLYQHCKAMNPSKLFCVSCYFQWANLHPFCKYITI